MKTYIIGGGNYEDRALCPSCKRDRAYYLMNDPNLYIANLLEESKFSVIDSVNDSPFEDVVDTKIPIEYGLIRCNFCDGNSIFVLDPYILPRKLNSEEISNLYNVFIFHYDLKPNRNIWELSIAKVDRIVDARGSNNFIANKSLSHIELEKFYKTFANNNEASTYGLSFHKGDLDLRRRLMRCYNIRYITEIVHGDSEVYELYKYKKYEYEEMYELLLSIFKNEENVFGINDVIKVKESNIPLEIKSVLKLVPKDIIKIIAKFAVPSLIYKTRSKSKDQYIQSNMFNMSTPIDSYDAVSSTLLLPENINLSYQGSVLRVSCTSQNGKKFTFEFGDVDT